MKQKYWLTLGAAALLPMAMACGGDDDTPEEGAADAAGNVTVDAAPQVDPDAQSTFSRSGTFQDLRNGAVEIAGSSVSVSVDLFAEELEIAAGLTSGGLAENEVVTVWWAFFNEPQNCENPTASLGALCGPPDLSIKAVGGALGYAGPAPAAGQIADANGEVTFDTAFTKPLNAALTADPDFFIGTGITDLENAEIWILLRTHGQALTGDLLDSQLSSFNGGCLEGEPNVDQCANILARRFAPLSSL